MPGTQQVLTVSEREIVNPLLRGFNPDPSIVRVGSDFFIATSTFEWYPGVQIHHSRDLKNWQLVSRPLDEERLLNLLGTPDSCGVWAPCLTWHDDLFWLAFTDVKRFDGNFKDTHNFLTTAPDINGPWSDPVYLNSSGFDPSIYHADDGRKWYLNMVWDHRPDRSFFSGIVMQEYDVERRALLGEPSYLFRGTGLDYTEAPHLYQFGDYYYLLTAEGGTGYGHAITVARSKSIDGPYEADPKGPMVTARNDPDWPLQRAGHGDIVDLEDGSLYVVFLVSRRIGDSRHSPMGRETAIQPVHLTDDGWLRLADGDALPQVSIKAPDLASYEVDAEIELDDFDDDALNVVYQWLRTPNPDEFYTLRERPGYLRLFGQESPGSLFRQSLIARRQTEGRFIAETSIEFGAENFQQMAGLIVYYNSAKFHYLYISHDEEIGKHLGVLSCEADFSLAASFPLDHEKIALTTDGDVRLRAVADYESLRFSWCEGDSDAWQEVPAELDMRFLTDQAGRDFGEQFTGTFVGVCAHDVSGQRAHADFDYFSLRNIGDGD